MWKTSRKKTKKKKIGKIPEVKKTPLLKKTTQIKNEKRQLSPWMQNAPLDEDESEQLMVDNEQAHELLSIASEGTQSRKNLSMAATLFVRVSRLPIKEIRANCLYNAACCYSLLKNKDKNQFHFLSPISFADNSPFFSTKC